MPMNLIEAADDESDDDEDYEAPMDDPNVELAMDAMLRGPCCACGKVDGELRNVLMLDLRARKEGTGWGCNVCGLPPVGAIAIVCDACLEIDATILYAIDGPPMDGGRVLIVDLPKEPFRHDMKKHEAWEHLVRRPPMNYARLPKRRPYVH